MLDLFCGRGGASAAMRDRGWQVLGVDSDPELEPDIVADVTQYEPPREPWDLLWASPPCTEFSRESMPWSKTGEPPSIALVARALAIIAKARPRYWAIENVRGAKPWLRPVLGPPIYKTGPVFIWGDLPMVLLPPVRAYKTNISGKRPDLRSKLPYEIGNAVALAVELAP